MMRYLSRLSLMTRQQGYTRFQYASNFHIKRKEDLLPFDAYFYPIAENLVLNGNVGVVYSEATYKFLRMCTKVYERIWWIPGPLELSHPTKCMSSQFDKMRELVDALDGTVYLGSKSSIVLPKTDLSILATTSWGTESDLDTTVRWFESTSGKAKPLNPEDLLYLAECEHTWMSQKLTERPKYKKLVFTHHEPDAQFMARYGKQVEAVLLGNRSSISGSLRKGAPWLGCNPFLVNGVKSSGYVPYAFYETKSQHGSPGGGVVPSGFKDSNALVAAY